MYIEEIARPLKAVRTYFFGQAKQGYCISLKTAGSTYALDREILAVFLAYAILSFLPS